MHMTVKSKRMDMVRAMEYIARQVSNDEVLDLWVNLGVVGNDIPYSVLTDGSEEWLEKYITDEGLSNLMRVFLRVMAMAYAEDGLWCAGVSSKEGNSGYATVKLNVEREEY